MQMMIALGCRKMGMTVAEAVSAATINAAHAVRRSRSIGSIKHGKIADVIILGIPDYCELPYHFGTNMVDITIKNGRIVHERSEVRWPGLSMSGTPERDASLSGLRCFS
jgi:imidazolonepropionase